MYMYIWASAVELGCSGEGSFSVSTVLYLSARSRGGERSNRRRFAAGHGCCSQYNQSPGAGELSPPPPPQHRSGGCHSCLAALPKPSGVTRPARSASSTRASWQTSTVPPSLCTTALSPGCTARLRPGPLCSRAESHSQINASTLQEPQSLVKYLGLQLVKQEGVSNIGNADPIGSGWLHTAPLPSARKESASATLPPHMVTYNTSLPFLSPCYPLCVWCFNFLYIFFLLCILETKLPQLFQGTTISGVKKDLHIPCFTNKAIKAFWVPDSTWAEPECSLYISYQIQFLKGEEVSLIALIKECVWEREREGVRKREEQGASWKAKSLDFG